MHRLLVSAFAAALLGGVSAVVVELPATPAPGAAAVPDMRSTTPGGTPRWVAVLPAPGCERSTDRYACHRVTVEGTGVDCDPAGCVLAGGGAGWSAQMELEAEAGMYAADPPVTPGG